MGTRLIASKGDSALDGVYKLVAVKEKGEWVPAIKLSETPKKTLNPGNKMAWRIYDKRGNATADVLTINEGDPMENDVLKLHHPSDHTKYRILRSNEISRTEPLLIRVLDEGKLAYEFPTIEEIRIVRTDDIEKLDSGVRRIMNPHIYHVSLSEKLWDLKQKLIRSIENEGG